MDQETLAAAIGKAIADAFASEVMPMLQTKLVGIKSELTQFVLDEVRRNAHPGRDGQPGRDGLPGVSGTNGKDGKDGRDGEDGAPGRGLDPDTILEWTAAEAQSRGFKVNEVVTHRGGTFLATEDTAVEPGTEKGTTRAWLPVYNGICDLRIAPTASAFEFQLVTELSDGKQIATTPVALPVPAHKGLFEEGAEYQYLNMVALNGSTWICCVATTKAAPGDSPDWKLMAQKGDKGKRGESVGSSVNEA